MNILIIGCNRTGTLLAQRLAGAGHELALIDHDAARLQALGAEEWFHGLTQCGLPIDADTLAAAGIDSCEAVFALTEEDTVNIMVAQIAQQQYHIRQVWALIRDPFLKDAYGRSFAIWTVCPGQLTADALYQSFMGSREEQMLAVGNDTLRLRSAPMEPALVGLAPAAACAALAQQGRTLVGIVREGGELVAAGSAGAALTALDSLLLAEVTPGALPPPRRGRANK